MSRIIICGINGKMGNHIYDVATKRGHHVVCGVDLKMAGTADCPVYSDFDQVKEFADAVIDFSSPNALDGLLRFAITNELPLVLGATGYTEKDEEAIFSASKKIPIFKSSNTSLAVNLLVKLCSIATKYLSGFDVEIIDKHHAQKKDSPSGTAKMLCNAIQMASSEDLTAVYGRKGKGKRKSDEIGVHSIRGGTVVGEHSVLYLGENESLALTHTAYSKELFADGAIKACEFIIKQPCGKYDMNDLLPF